MLTLTRITKSFGGRRVLDGIDLHVAAGESVALLGANGCGKTTTLRCIVGLTRPDAGRIEIAGLDTRRRPLLARAYASYLPQKSVFPATLSVRETLAVVARLRHAGVEAVARELDSCGLARLADRPVGQLSGGERQRLAMAVAFLPCVNLYLFDEPSANLDPVAFPNSVPTPARIETRGLHAAVHHTRTGRRPSSGVEGRTPARRPDRIGRRR